MKIVIIEDEKITARDLVRTITAIEPDAEIIGLFHTVVDSINFLKVNNDADLIFSDIQLTDGDCFEIFSNINIIIPIIFCTAFNNFYTNAFAANGIAYLLKPFSKKTVEKALEKYQTLKASFIQKDSLYQHTISNLSQALNTNKNALLVRQRERIIPLNTGNLALVYVNNGGNYAITFTLEKYAVTETLEEVERLFGAQFFRVNRQFLINRAAVKDASNLFNRKLLVNLTFTFKTQIIVGKLKTVAFLKWLSKN
jgi:two-component system, LytTR family, response regulator LytT